MIASGVVVYVSCQLVDFRKGAASLMALVRDGGLDPFNGALYVFRSKTGGPCSHRLVGWQRCLPLFENPRGAELLLAGHIGRQDTSGPFAINGASGRSGLEEDPANQGQTAVADGLNRTAAR